MRNPFEKPEIHFHIITLFPEVISPYLTSSLMKRAIEKGKVKVSTYNPRDFSDNKWKKIDDRPYGGGPGMVLEALPILKAYEKTVGKKDAEVIFFTPHGEQFTTALAEELKTKKDIVFISGHYEGVDARVKEILHAREVSIGNYTLTGGELPSLVMIDAITRRIPGVLGNQNSVEERRVAGKDVYTRPECFTYKGKEHCVPEVLKTGHHANIDAFRKN